MVPFAIAGVQMTVSATEDNPPEMRRQLDILAQRFPWVQMVVFSELAVCGPVPRAPQPAGGPLEDAFRDMAARHSLWLIPGSYFEIEGDRVFNTAPVIDPAGTVVARYRKMFPFLPYEEGVEGGQEFLVFDVPGVGRFGLSICYDMWFPETTRTLVAKGAEVIIHPSLTNTIDRDVEHSIAQATAAINQCYVFDVNGVGDGGYGRSVIVGPHGNIIYQAGSGPEIIPVQLNLERVRYERNNGILGLGQILKSFRDRRVDFDVYRPETFDNSYLDSLGPLQKATRAYPTGAGAAATAGARPPGAVASPPPGAYESTVTAFPTPPKPHDETGT